jgi:hypothetical protein
MKLQKLSLTMTALTALATVSVHAQIFATENFNPSIDKYSIDGTLIKEDFITASGALAISGNDLHVMETTSTKHVDAFAEYNADTGVLINPAVTTVFSPSSFTVSGNTLYVAASGNVATYDTMTGALLNPSLVNLGSQFNSNISGLTIADGNLYLTNAGANNANAISLAIVNANTGAVVTELHESSSSVASVVIGNDLFVSEVTGLLPNGSGIVEYNALTGAVINPLFIADSNYARDMVVVGNDLIVANSFGNDVGIAEYDLTTGDEITDNIAGTNINGIGHLAVETPEPSTWAMLVAGGLGLFGFPSSRRSAIRA